MGPGTDGYLRLPTVHRDTVVFVSEDDLWTVPAAGGRAWRLTAGVAEASHPRLSPDGSLLAFVGADEGPSEVYVMPADGGVSNRLTYQGARLRGIAGWDPSGAIVYASNAGQPHHPGWLHRISPHGGLPRRVELGPARSVSYGPDGGMVIGRRIAREPAWWKRYRGGTAGDLWIDRTGAGQFARLVELDGNLVDPCWLAGRVYFLSDHEGIGNVYSVLPDGTDLRRHSDHHEYYARNLSSDGRSMVYQCAGELYLLRPDQDGPSRIDVRLDSSRTQRGRRFVPADRYLHSIRLSPDGSRLAVTARGKAYSFGNWEGPVSQHGEPDGTRYRLLSWLPDGARLVAAASDDRSDEHLVLLTADGSAPPRRLTGTDLGRVLNLAVSPTADQVAVTTHRQELWLVDLTGAEPAVRRVDHSEHDPVADPAWSPDGRWLAYSYDTTPDTTAIKLCRVATGDTTLVTAPLLRDYRPSFDPKGRYLYFIGQRDFAPVYDQLQFELGFPSGARPYAVALRRDVPSPFVPRPRPLHDNGKSDHNGKPDNGKPDNGKPDQEADADQDQAADGAGGDSPTPVEIDLDGITGRVVAFPVPVGRYGQVAGTADKVVFSSRPVVGLTSDELLELTPKPNGTIEVFDLTSQERETLVESVSDFRLSADHRTLLYLSGKRPRVIKTGEKPAKDDDGNGRASGWVDLDRVKVSVRPAAEWRQMYREAWRLQREHFWTEDMSGVDWDLMYQRYLPLVDRVTTRAEFSDLLWELQGELGTSHAYETGGEYRDCPHYRQGMLGVDWELDGDRYRFGHIVTGDVWTRQATSPLNRPGTDVRPGDELLAVNGQPVGGQQLDGVRPATPGERLVHLAGQEVRLTVRRGDGEPHTVEVRAIGDEQPARYRDWVEGNRAAVHERTGGRVGYLHIPDMDPDGYAEFHRGFLTEYGREALVVDVRYNGGGHVSSLLLEKLLRRRVGYVFQRWSTPSPFPPESPRGPLVAVSNEWTGSDGDIFCHVFKLMKLGPVVGKRTWGGVVGIYPQHALADGTITTQPEASFWFDDVHWQVENRGAEPDFDVEIAPQDYAAGVDPQLDRAIEVALERLAEQPAHTPQVTGRPRLTAPELPPRTSPVP